MRLDFDTLYREAQGESFALAKQKFYDNKISSVSTSETSGKTVICATVKGRSDHCCKIVFDEQGGLYDYGCDCNGFDIASGPCKHILAAALAYEEQNPNDASTSPLRMSDGVVSALISTFGKDARRHAIGREISLTPTLILDETPAISFHIGNKKNYRLKDLHDFSSAVTGRAYRRYGAELAFYHYPSAFDEKSKRLLKMIAHSYKHKNLLVVDGYALDEFFDIISGTNLRLEQNGAPMGTKKVSGQMPKVMVKVAKAEGGFVVDSNCKGMLLRGVKNDYLISDAIYTLPEKGAEIFSFCSATPFFVGDDDMSTFYNKVLCSLPEATLSADCDLTVFEAPPLKSELYLDFDGEKVYGEVKTFYGDTEVSLEEDEGDYRDTDAENELKDILKSVFPDYPTLELATEEQIFHLLRDGLSKLYDHAEIFLTENFHGLKFSRSPSIRVRVKREGSLIDLSYDTDGMDKARLEEILQGIKAGRKFIRIGESFVDLSEAGRTLKGILNLPSQNGKVASYYSQYIKAELDELGTADCSDLEQKEVRDYVPDPRFSSVFRSYQLTGYKWLKAMADFGYGGILADDMGLGKSLQTIALINDLLQESELGALVVCPTTLILNWVDEFKKFAPWVRTKVVSGPLEDRLFAIRSLKKGDVAITSYELLRRDARLYENTFSLVVADEAQYIKNPLTKNAGAIKSIKAERKLALTGTPIENSLSELWSIFDFLMPGYLFDYETFREQLETRIAHGETDAAERLKKMISPFVLRRMKSEVLKELPKKMESTVLAPLEDAQKDMYTAHVKLVKDGLSKKSGKFAVLAMLTKLRQICCDPSLVQPDYTGNSTKLDALLQILSNAISSGHKTLVFSQFTSMLEIIAKKLDERGWSYFVLKGDTPKNERIKLVNTFNSDETSVFLISLKAGGTGINLTGADIVVHYDPWWNDSVMNQATDRSYRIGQQKSVQVYKLIMSGSVEDKIMELQKNKANLSNNFNGTTDALAQIIDFIEKS